VNAERPQLLIVVGAVGRQVSDDDLRHWMTSQRAFVSSVMGELAEEHRAVAERIRRVGGQPVWFEAFGGMDDDPETVYLAQVRSSTIYLGILGREYGRRLHDGFSATEAEYLAAEQAGLRLGVWAKEVSDREGHAERFSGMSKCFGLPAALLRPLSWRMRSSRAFGASPRRR
jgi:uncharacterized protein DUF4062